MRYQDVLFVIDNYEVNESFFSQLRLCIYELRESAFKQDKNVRLSFCRLTAEDEVSNNISFYNLDEFSISAENQNHLFSDVNHIGLQKYLENSRAENSIPPKIIYFKNRESSSLKNYVALALVMKEMKVQYKEVLSTNENDVAQNARKVLRKKSSAVSIHISKKMILGGIAACAVIALVSCLPLLIQKTVLSKIEYQKVYTGDGDRLILRKEGNQQADEIMRLNEEECVQLIERGEEWNQVNYHGLTGFMRNIYLVEAEETDYLITNPDSKYAYGKACVKFLEPSEVDGYVWIREAAEEQLIRAQWAMYGYYDKGTDRIKKDKNESNFWLSQIYENNDSCVEDGEVKLWEKTSESFYDEGNKALGKKFKDKAKERSRNVKEIRQQAAKKLSELYYNTDIKAASDYYKRAVELGIKGDTDYMLNLAKKSSSTSDKLYWADKAISLGSGEAAWYLATNYYKDYDSIPYYKKAYQLNYNASAASCAIGEFYYKNGIDYSKAREWFVKCINKSDYSMSYYKCCYYLGVLYELGAGGLYKSYDYAMYYYKKAYYKITEAKTRYDDLAYYYGDIY